MEEDHIDRFLGPCPDSGRGVSTGLAGAALQVAEGGAPTADTHHGGRPVMENKGNLQRPQVLEE